MNSEQFRSNRPPNFFMDNNPVIFWNVRGLNSRAKRTAVRSVICSSAPCIVCLQETKLDFVSPSLVTETLGAAFQDFYFLPANGTRGGILLAWQSSLVSLSHPTIGTHHVTALATPAGSESHWWLTGVYGPQSDPDKLEFLSELHDLRATMAGPWIIGGDFNMVLFAADKNNERLNRRIMHRFRRFTADMELHDLYLHGRRYTWSNEQRSPTLVRIDRVLCTPSWEIAHPNCSLRCLASAASDHCPLVVDCSPPSRGPRRFHFERFWPKLDGYLQVISDAWASV